MSSVDMVASWSSSASSTAIAAGAAAGAPDDDIAGGVGFRLESVAFAFARVGWGRAEKNEFGNEQVRLVGLFSLE